MALKLSSFIAVVSLLLTALICVFHVLDVELELLRGDWELLIGLLLQLLLLCVVCIGLG
jgi:hypothetical protein